LCYSVPITMSRAKPNLLVTGTPGTGKTRLAARLQDSLGFNVINVGDFSKENDCLGEWDDDYQSHEIEEDKLLDLLEPRLGQGEGGVIVEHHVPDLFPERWFDLVLVLRCNNTELYDRLSGRGYTGRKLEENVQAEIFQTILEEAQAGYREEVVVEMQSETEQQLDSNVARVTAWLDQWTKDRGQVRPGKRRADN